ncbi:MAG: hypothetical protein K8R56_07490 [Candidatus Eisenbacteria bacterium]|nr:hypothetical protein [Candidatus Eisenbacteria bacterium]
MTTLPVHPPANGKRHEQGFILVGVVMFMLALTILGLSLFALSSYEAQFFYANVSREQAMHSSESGMEVVRALITDPSRASTARLEDAQLAVGQFGITKALAYQRRSTNVNDTTSRGIVKWDSTLFIVVTTQNGGETRTIESQFLPVQAKNPYKSLITAGLGVFYNTANTSQRNVELTGKVWQRVLSPSDSAWTSQVRWLSGRPMITSLAPALNADAFVDNRLPGASAPTRWDDDKYELVFQNNGSSNSTRFFRSPASPHSAENRSEYDQYTFYSDAQTTIFVRGTCVWVVPQGVCFRQRVTIQPDGPGGTLVIVAKANGRDTGYENRGIWFQSGLVLSDPSNTRLFLVSDGDIGLTHIHQNNSDNTVSALSIVAGGDIELMGPGSGSTFRLMHPNSMDFYADDLLARGALPSISGGTGTGYAFAGSSWKESRLP